MPFFHVFLLCITIALDSQLSRAWLSPHRQYPSSTRLFLSSPQPPDEASQMSNFIRNYLNQQKGEVPNNQDESITDALTDLHKKNSNKQTQKYLIAVPMETCHELALELESIQRAILYHCPILVHACVPAAALRVPLLQVETSVEEGSKNVKTDLQQVQACMEMVLQSPALQQEPWMVSWKGLKRKGINNSVLCATSDYVSPLVNSFAQSLNQTLQQQAPSWTLSWAQQDEPETELELSFLKLPDNWDTILQNTHNMTADEMDNRSYTLTSDQGGNGISPLFWIQYMEDTFGQDSLRLPEIGLYAASSGEAFASWPSLTWPLPVGTNQTILRREREFQDYQEERMQKAEKSLKRPEDSEDQKQDVISASSENDEEDIMLSKTRQRLEQLYAQPDQEMPSASDATDDELTNKDNKTTIDADSMLTSIRPETPQDPAVLDGWMREKIQSVIASRARERSLQQLSIKKDKPAIEDNPVFAKFKDGTLVPETPKAPSSPAPEFPPYPSCEHMVGFWRMVRSPTGFEPLENSNDRSENLILRIDGTTAGGPVLDQETQQKASGGTWSLSGDTTDTARLLIRLVIPPKKERVLVMEGALERVSAKGQNFPMASNTFGIPALKELKSRNEVEMEDFLFCGGQVWIEDVDTARNRDEIGNFSVMKLNLSNDPTQYSITVPRPVRNQD